MLLQEQKNFCAYTEEYININDAVDIEHFNPNLKYTDKDSYYNWFMVKHKPNNKKGLDGLNLYSIPQMKISKKNNLL
ncbi:hypothetical protein JJC04_01160 [Flavobacterium covae]|nr:hypothetical protein JJC04_01160 [Flavobacterium covae]